MYGGTLPNHGKYYEGFIKYLTKLKKLNKLNKIL